jgi:hypothetical protein
MTTSGANESNFAAAFRLGLAGMRANLIPGLILWMVGIGILTAFFAVPSARPFFDAIAAWKQDGGLWASAILIAGAGGLVPFVTLHALGRTTRGFLLGHLITLLGIWAYRGVEVDLFYRLQSMMFGDGGDGPTLLKKVLVDQGIYTALWTTPTTTVLYLWLIEERGSWSNALKRMDGRFWRVTIPGAVMAAWTVWIPMVCIINSLPIALRVPVLAVAVVFWSLCMSVLASRPRNI